MFLLVPAGTEGELPTDDVVALYRERKHIELIFRDSKTPLGARGLRLEVEVAPRLGRLLLALSLGYILAVLLSPGPLARAGCARTSRWYATRRARDEWHRLLAALARGTPTTEIAP